MSFASCFWWPLYHLEVMTAFINFVNEEEMYINQPRDFDMHGQDSHVRMFLLVP